MNLTEADYRLILAALDKKIWSLRQSGASGAYYALPRFEELRDRVDAHVGAQFRANGEV